MPTDLDRMFYTLKAAHVAGEPYAFEATPPPFSKKREGKMSKVACTNCRTSKVCLNTNPKVAMPIFMCIC